VRKMMMMREMCKSKIHRATVSGVNLNYEGSISIDRQLMEAADLYPYEKVQIANLHNGSRADTYVIEAPPGSGEICLNGAMARLAQPGDLVIIIAYALIPDEEAASCTPKIVHVNQKNQIV
jgi:aspartate 1-decarboxylase